MKRRPLGLHGPAISAVGFGAWEAGGDFWGPNPSDERVIAALTTAFHEGVDWVDTAEVYGRGRSEELVARAIEGRDVLAFTKVAPKPTGSGFDRDGVRAAVQGSLRRLRRDHIDLYQLHWRDPGPTPIEETWQAMASLVDEGLVRFIGVSNFDRQLIERCETIRHVDSLQPEFSMLHQKGRRDLFPFCRRNGTGIVCYGTLAYGLLTGTMTRETRFSDDDWRSGKRGVSAYDELFAPRVFERNLDVVETLRPIAGRLAISMAQLAIAWALHQEGVTGVIAGSRSPAHMAENARAGLVELSEADLEEIDSLLAPAGVDV